MTRQVAGPRPVVHFCAYCGRPTTCVCNQGHGYVWLCAPELRDCWMRHRQENHGA